MSAEDRIAYWRQQGFTEARTFCAEYVLLVNLATMAKIRVYDNGTEWIADDRTVDYRRVDASCPSCGRDYPGSTTGVQDTKRIRKL